MHGRSRIMKRPVLIARASGVSAADQNTQASPSIGDGLAWSCLQAAAPRPCRCAMPTATSSSPATRSLIHAPLWYPHRGRSLASSPSMPASPPRTRKAQLVLDLGALADVAYSGISSTSTPRRGQPRVLVVDDSRLAREAVARLLATAGYQAVAAQDGRRMAGKPGRSWASAVSTPWSPCWKCHVSTAFQPATTTVPKKQATSRNVSPRLWKRIYLFDWTVGSDTIPASQGIFGLIPRLSFRAIFWIRSMASITD